jgi:hypothetical protein
MALIITTGGHTLAGMRDYSDQEIDLVRKSFSGRYALRDRCYFEMSLQMGLRVSEMLSITVGQVYQYGRVVDEVSIERKHMKGGKAGKASGATIPLFPETYPHILACLTCLAAMLKVELKDLPSEAALLLACAQQGRQPASDCQENGVADYQGYCPGE